MAARHKSPGSTKGRHCKLLKGRLVLHILLLLIGAQLAIVLNGAYNHSFIDDNVDHGGSANSLANLERNRVESAVAKKTLQKSQMDLGHETELGLPVGTFNNHPVYYRENDKRDLFHSTVHCVGETFSTDRPWAHRSCEFRNLCFDLDEQEFVLFRSDTEKRLSQALDAVFNNSRFPTSTYSMQNMTVSIGGINPKWGRRGKSSGNAMEWFPTIIDSSDVSETGFYELPAKSVLVPFHSFAGFNVGHLVWDDFMPVYTLMSIFQLLDDSVPILVRYVLRIPTGRGLWATCDVRDEQFNDCKTMFAKFLPTMGISPDHFRSSRESFLQLEKGQRRSKYVCAPRGAAGIGMLTDHGQKFHGWEKADYAYSVNSGKGALFYNFRNFMMNNLEIDNVPVSKSPFRITFSILSSTRAPRETDFRNEISLVQKEFADNPNVVVEAFQFAKMSLVEQVKIASQSSIIITACGGGAVTSMFLPKGASLIVYYDENGGIKGNQHTGEPALLDWDYLNNAAYIRTHWLPIRKRKREENMAALVQLIHNELEVISHHDV
mmetsp:Transcript_27667/g.50246  ORF Transcript_27667/g.50246 Transcript_27667/m.50246 type:complete len:548 (-) Transcript_27667:216-1859(-)